MLSESSPSAREHHMKDHSRDLLIWHACLSNGCYWIFDVHCEQANHIHQADDAGAWHVEGFQ